MTARRAGALLALLALGAGCRSEAPAAAPGDKPTLYLSTSLPLLFGEGFALDAARPAVVGALEQRFTLTAIDLPSQLPDGAMLLAVQPRALPAEELVALDAWVRRGGRLVLLADPMLEWPSERELGDKMRPPIMFDDTGLLTHWGLRLDAPDARGPVPRGDLVMVSPGTLVTEKPGCAVEADGAVARCAIGAGRAVVVADADWLNDTLVGEAKGDPARQHAAFIELLESVAPAR